MDYTADWLNTGEEPVTPGSSETGGSAVMDSSKDAKETMDRATASSTWLWFTLNASLDSTLWVAAFADLIKLPTVPNTASTGVPSPYHAIRGSTSVHLNRWAVLATYKAKLVCAIHTVGKGSMELGLFAGLTSPTNGLTVVWELLLLLVSVPASSSIKSSPSLNQQSKLPF